MKRLFLLYLLFIFTIIGCYKNDNIIEPEEPLNQILFISSFENDGQPNNNGWFIYNKSPDNYSTDTPTNGGKFSLCLKGDTLNHFGQLARIILPGIGGTNTYKFSFWSKAQGCTARAGFYPVTPDIPPPEYFKSKTVFDSTWSYYSIFNTFPLTDNDSIALYLVCNDTLTTDGKVYFDLCKLEKINSK